MLLSVTGSKEPVTIEMNEVAGNHHEPNVGLADERRPKPPPEYSGFRSGGDVPEPFASQHLTDAALIYVQARGDFVLHEAPVERQPLDESGQLGGQSGALATGHYLGLPAPL